SSIAKHNIAELPALLDLALEIGADALHLFMLVPVGCGLQISPAEMLSAGEYERVLRWFDDQSKSCPIDLKATCAPHYYRIRAKRLEGDRRNGDMGATVVPPGPPAKRAPHRLHARHVHRARRGRDGGAVAAARRRARSAPLGDDPRLPRRHRRLLR